MSKEKKFNSQRFRSLMTKKLKEKNYTVNRFAVTHDVPRQPIARAMIGVSRPSVESLNKWCQLLECTSEERTEMFHSVGHFTPEELAEDEEEESSHAAA